MSSPRKAAVPRAASPQYGAGFDPWNSSSTGHQRPEHQPGTGWRESRSKKLHGQFAGGSSGGDRMADTWGAGSEDWDDKHRVLMPKAVQARARRSVVDMLVRPDPMRESLAAEPRPGTPEPKMERRRVGHEEEAPAEAGARGIFDGVVVYVNGSTFPLVSDHKLKHILAENGGHLSIHLGRRKVTHIIVGRPTGSGHGAGAGLAGGKLEREIKRTGGCGVKFVGVEWVLESLKAGKRLPEARFSNMKLASQRQGSVYGFYSKQTSKS